MTKYITVKLTEDQHKKLLWVVGDWIGNAEYMLKHSLNPNYKFLNKELAFAKRLRTALNKGKISTT